jgi:phage terminase large subunit-like protein
MKSNWFEEYNTCTAAIWRFEHPEQHKATRAAKVAAVRAEKVTGKSVRDEVLDAIEHIAECTTLAITTDNIHRVICRKRHVGKSTVTHIVTELHEQGAIRKSGRFARSSGRHDHATIYEVPQ